MKMTLIWIVLAILGSLLTVFSGIKLAQERTNVLKTEIQNIAHPIPKRLYFDAQLTFKTDSVFQKFISEKIVTKISDINRTPYESDFIPLVFLLDEVALEKDLNQKTEYKIDKTIFEGLKNLQIKGQIKISPANNIEFESFYTNRKFTSENDLYNYSSIEILAYNRLNNLIEVNIKNFRVNVFRNIYKNSLVGLEGRIINLDIQSTTSVGSNSRNKIYAIGKSHFKLNSIKNFEIKTENSSYYKISELDVKQKNEASGKLQSLLF